MLRILVFRQKGNKNRPSQVRWYITIAACFTFVAVHPQAMQTYMRFINKPLEWHFSYRWDFSFTGDRRFIMRDWVKLKRMHLLTYFPHRAGSSLRSWSVLIQSRNSPCFMEPQRSLPHSQGPVTCPYSEPYQANPYPHKHNANNDGQNTTKFYCYCWYTHIATQQLHVSARSSGRLQAVYS